MKCHILATNLQEMAYFIDSSVLLLMLGKLLLGQPDFGKENKMAEKIEPTFAELIEMQVQKLIDSYNKSDWVRLAELYSEELLILEPGQPVLKGWEPAVALFKGAKESGAVEMQVAILQAEQCEDHAFLIASIKYFTRDKTLVMDMRYLVVCVHESGEWKISMSCGNANPLPDPVP